jgi:hypothetical protein
LFVNQQFFNLRSFGEPPELLKKRKALIKTLVRKPNLTISGGPLELFMKDISIFNEANLLFKEFRRTAGTP